MLCNLLQLYRLSKPAISKLAYVTLVTHPYFLSCVCPGTGLTIVAAAFCKMNTRKKLRSTYSEESMKEAFHLVKKKKFPIRKAARQCRVPVQTLRDRISRGVDVTPAQGASTLLTEEEEKELMEHIMHRASGGYPLSQKEIIQIASDTAVYLKKRQANDSVTRAWFRRFMGRWPELNELQAKESEAEKKPLTPTEKLNKFFCELANIIEKHDLMDKPELIFMVTEVDFYTFSKKEDVIDQSSLEQDSNTTDPEKTARIFACGNAAGTALPPYFIFKGQRCKKHLLEGALPGVGGKASLDGCSNPLIYQHFLHHFIEQAPAKSKSQHVLLLYDQRFSHIPMPLITEATKRNIILFALPSSARKIYQPLDDCLRMPLKSFFKAECERYWDENPFQIIIRDVICSLVCKAYVEAFSPTQLANSFKSMGIFPPNASDEIKIDDGPMASPEQIACEQVELESENMQEQIELESENMQEQEVIIINYLL